MTIAVTPSSLPFKLPRSIVKQGEALIEQQMWCWGCDVRRKEGNLLLTYGFARRPSPQTRWHSAYTRAAQSGYFLTLWGWGLWIAAPDIGSLFLGRSGFRLGYTPQTDLYPQAWQPDQLPPLHEPRDPQEQHNALTLLGEALDRIAAYEAWLTTQLPIDYRTQTIAAWPLRRRYHGGVTASELAPSWHTLSEVIRKEYC